MKILFILLSVLFVDDDIPARYETGPFLAKVYVYNLTPSERDAFCNYDAHEEKAYACVRWGKGSQLSSNTVTIEFPDSCNIFLVSIEYYKTDVARYFYTLKHELAHCRGWPSDHPN